MMAILNRRKTLSNAVSDWSGRGVIDKPTAEILLADISSQIKTRSFSSIIMLLGAICLCFGIMTFVAANWDAMSSLTRVGLLIAALWAAWGISIILKAQNRDWASHIFVMLACGIFGACIMLISQIYHLQGEPKDAVWLWAIGTGLAALATRSVPALVLYIILITLWAVMDFDLFGRESKIEYSYLIYWSLGALGAWIASSRFSAHVLSASLVFWLLYMVGESLGREDIRNLLPLYSVLACSFISIAVMLYSDGAKQWIKGFEGSAIIYLMILVAGLVLIWYLATDLRWTDKWRIVSAAFWPGFVGAVICGAIAFLARRTANPNWYDIAVTAAFAAITCVLSGSATRVPFIMEAFMLALSIWTIRMGWRLEYRAMSTLGFLGFSGVMLLIYFETLGNLLGTSLFYLGAGVLLLVGAFLIPKFMRKASGQGAKT